MKTSINRIFSTTYQQVLKYLAAHPSGEFTEREIQEGVLISRAGANFALRALVRDGLIQAEKKGKTAFYSISLDNPVIRQIKVLINIIEIESIISELHDVSDKVVLFGSAATGTNIEESDIDLFVLANQLNNVMDVVRKSRLAEKIQAVIKKPMDYITLQKKDPVFYDEISRGLVLWEKKQ